MIPQDITEVLDRDGDVWRRREGDGWVFNGAFNESDTDLAEEIIKAGHGVRA